MIRIPPSLKNRRFFYLWLGQLLSIAGTQMQIWALLWHIRTLTDKPIALGGVGLARILPVIVFSLVGGAIADSFDRRKILFITQTSAALLAFALGLLTQFGQITIWLIYAITALQAIAIAFDGPARQALVPNLVPAKDLPNAFSMTSIAWQTGSILGPALTGFVIAFGGQEAVYYINAISYLAVIIALILIGPIPQTKTDRIAGVSWNSIQEGIHFIVSKPVILSTMLLDFVATFFASANTLMPIIARDVLHVGVVAYGWLSAAASAGRQLQTPDHIRGRMTSVNQIFFQGGPQLGEVEAGVVAQLFGAPFAIISGGIGCIIGLWLIIRKWPLLLTYNGDEHLPAGAPAD